MSFRDLSKPRYDDTKPDVVRGQEDWSFLPPARPSALGGNGGTLHVAAARGSFGALGLWGEGRSSMAKPQFTQVWNAVVALAGETFKTKTALPFTYEANAAAVFPSRTKYRIPRSDFETAFKLVPISGP